MITSDKTIRPFRVQRFAVLDAMNHYGKWKRVWIAGVICFWIDLVDHLINGFVLVRPDLFWMMRIIDISKTNQPEPAWFVRFSIGDLQELLSTMPCYLPKICFCRRNDGRVRCYSVDKLIKKANAIQRSR